MLLNDLKNKLDILLRKDLAYDWDNVGLILSNDDNKNIKRILITLEIDDQVISEAIEKKIDLVISHHPLIFSPIKTITSVDKKSKMIIRLISNSISVYVSHTNFDILDGGLNDYVANILELKNINKITFEKANYNSIIRYGYLKNKMRLDEFIDFIKLKLNLTMIRVVDGNNDIIDKVGIVTGSGMEYSKEAFNLNCDTYITGDVEYHDAQDWVNSGMNILDVGHFGSEIHFRENLFSILKNEYIDEFDLFISDALKDPFRMR